MTLDPDTYECPDHHTDLTSLVEEALELQGPPLAYQRPPGPRQFQVIVTCPGDGTGAHSLTCAGQRARDRPGPPHGPAPQSPTVPIANETRLVVADELAQQSRSQAA